MITLNLTSLEKSDLKYKIIKFPDGQQQVNIIGWRTHESKEWGSSFCDKAVQIKSRYNNFMDLELITCATRSLRDLGVKEIHLYTPYFLGSRSDRKFEEGSNNYLKEVSCPPINDLNFNSVTVMDPHSDVLEACLNNFQKIDNLTVVESFISDTNAKLNDFVLVSPDGGSLKKIYKIAEKINYNGEIIVCSKHRNEEGKLTKTDVPLNIAHHEKKNFVIIDDICDGGKTFIEIAKEIKNKIHKYNVACENEICKSKISLVVTHGIFSKGFQELAQYFDNIYTTNSYKDLSDIIVFEGEIHPNSFVKQRNLF